MNVKPATYACLGLISLGVAEDLSRPWWLPGDPLSTDQTVPAVPNLVFAASGTASVTTITAVAPVVFVNQVTGDERSGPAKDKPTKGKVV